MTEHLDADELTTRSADVLFLNLSVDVGHLIHVQLAGEYHHIGKLSIELQGLDVRDVQLGGEVYLHATVTAVGHHRHVGGDDSRDLRFLGGIDDLSHRL